MEKQIFKWQNWMFFDTIKRQKISQGLLSKFQVIFLFLAVLVRNPSLPSIYSCSVVITASWSHKPSSFLPKVKMTFFKILTWLEISKHMPKRDKMKSNAVFQAAFHVSRKEYLSVFHSTGRQAYT